MKPLWFGLGLSLILGMPASMTLLVPEAESVTTQSLSHKKNTSVKPTSRSGSKKPAGLSVSQRPIPVFWQATRSRFLSSGASSHTESFREVWHLEPRDEKTAYLVSPRGRAVVYGTQLSPDGRMTPAAVVIAEKDLAKLIGLTPATAESEESIEGQNLFRLVLSASPRGSETMTLKTSDDEQYTVLFEMGQQGAH